MINWSTLYKEICGKFINQCFTSSDTELSIYQGLPEKKSSFKIVGNLFGAVI